MTKLVCCEVCGKDGPHTLYKSTPASHEPGMLAQLCMQHASMWQQERGNRTTTGGCRVYNDWKESVHASRVLRALYYNEQLCSV